MAGEVYEPRAPLDEKAARDNLQTFLWELRRIPINSYADYAALTGPDGVSLQHAAGSLIFHCGISAPKNAHVRTFESGEDNWRFSAKFIVDPAYSEESVELERQTRKWFRVRNRKRMHMEDYRPDSVEIVDKSESHNRVFLMQEAELRDRPQALPAFVRTSRLLITTLLQETINQPRNGN